MCTCFLVLEDTYTQKSLMQFQPTFAAYDLGCQQDKCKCIGMLHAIRRIINDPECQEYTDAAHGCAASNTGWSRGPAERSPTLKLDFNMKNTSFDLERTTFSCLGMTAEVGLRLTWHQQ